MPTIEHLGWFTFTRRADAWGELAGYEQAALQGAAQDGAEALGGRVPPEPAAGWRSAAHSRDGKAYPCREQTSGAQPAWIWEVTR